MKCCLCDYDIVKPPIQKNGRGVCNNCTEEIRNENGEGQQCVINEILAFMHRRAEIEGSDLDKRSEIVKECTEKYEHEDILGAKQYLLKEYGEKLKECDGRAYVEINKTRIASHGRQAIVANLHDILTVFYILEKAKCDISTLSDVRDPLEEHFKPTIESRVANLEIKFNCIDSLNEENAKLRIENDILKEEVQELEASVARLSDEAEQLAEQLAVRELQAENKVKLLEAEMKALKDCDDKKDSPSHESGETPKDVGATNDATRTNRHTKQANAKASGNIRHQRNLKATQASSMLAAQAAAIGLPTDSASAIGNFAASAVAKSISFAKVAAVPRPDTSTYNGNQNPMIPQIGQPQSGLRSAAGRQVSRKRTRLSQTRPYKAGAGESIGLAAPKPSWYARKTLVIAGIDKKYLKDKKGLSDKLDLLANRSIDIQHMEVLSREVKGRAYNWLTVAIELSEDDFKHLVNLDTWETGIRIREFVGRRFWRQNKISKEDRLNSVRMSWE